MQRRRLAHLVLDFPYIQLLRRRRGERQRQQVCAQQPLGSPPLLEAAALDGEAAVTELVARLAQHADSEHAVGERAARGEAHERARAEEFEEEDGDEDVFQHDRHLRRGSAAGAPRERRGSAAGAPREGTTQSGSRNGGGEGEVCERGEAGRRQAADTDTVRTTGGRT